MPEVYTIRTTLDGLSMLARRRRIMDVNTHPSTTKDYDDDARGHATDVTKAIYEP